MKDLAIRDAQTTSIAEIAMAQASAYGKGMELVSRLNHCHDAKSLAIEVLQSFTAQGFHGVIQLRDGKHTQTFDADATECGLLKQAKDCKFTKREKNDQ